MKVYIALALLSVALATPLQPIILPRAPAPAVEIGIELPKPVLPAFETPDIQPMIIPKEVMEDLLAASIDNKAVVDAVIVVDHVDVFPLAAAEEDIDPVHVVDVAENNAADTPLDISPVEEPAVNGDAVIVVDHFELPENKVRHEEVDPVHVVDVAENIDYQGEELPALEVAPVNESDIAADAVRVIEAPIIANSDVADELTVKVVDAPLHPGKVFDNPMLR